MTYKEEIIIDGVNVLECEYYEYKSLKDCEMRYPESGDCEIGLLNYLFNGNLGIEKFCKDNPNCYYKQFARKTQECEELKKDLQDYESWFDEYKILFTYDGRTPVTNDELYTCLEELVKKGNDETNRYRKVFEEIEQELKEDIYCENQECGCDDFEECLKCTKDLILDIINKTKDGE